jgi:hypothetical protein
MHFEISERKMILRLFDVLLFYSFFMRLDIFRFRLSEAALTNRYRFFCDVSCKKSGARNVSPQKIFVHRS